MGVRKSILLVSAFAALLLVLAASAFAVWRKATNAQERVADLHNAHVQAGASLGAIRANVYLTGILTRDFLLDSDPLHAQQYIDQFAGIQKRTEESFSSLENSIQDKEQRLALAELRTQLNAYWDPTELVLDWSPEEKRAQRTVMLRQRVRRRQEIFSLATQIEHLMTENFQRERERITTSDREFRASLGWTTFTALLFGLVIGGATLARMLTLERQSQAAESGLRSLSGQIRTAQEEERRFLSRELHDQVGQMLTGVKMELASIARLHGDSESEISARIARAKGTVEQTLRIVRNTAMLLRPSMLDDLGLAPALAWLVKEVSRSSGIEMHADIDPTVDSLPDSHRTCIYRVVQEALTNAARHSGSRKVELSVRPRGEWVVCIVSDNGRGFDTTKSQKGLGLLGMEERVRELGGFVRLISTLGSGTRLEIRLPRPARKEMQGTHDDTHPDRGRSRDRSDRLEASA